MINVFGPRRAERVGSRPSAPSAAGSRTCRSVASASSTACSSFLQGEISADQFLDVNAKIGGLDIDRRQVPSASPAATRRSPPPTAAARSTRRTTSTPRRSSTTPDPSRAWPTTTATRCGCAGGSTANMAVTPTRSCGSASCRASATWAGHRKDSSRWTAGCGRSRRTPARNRSRRRWPTTSPPTSGPLYPARALPALPDRRRPDHLQHPAGRGRRPARGRPAQVPAAPPQRADYESRLTESSGSGSTSSSRAASATSRQPGVGEQNTVGWQTYQDAKGKVIYGGKPMPAAPKARQFGCLAARAAVGTRGIGRIRVGRTRRGLASLPGPVTRGSRRGAGARTPAIAEPSASPSLPRRAAARSR